MSQFEFRCPIHGHIADVNMDLYETEKTCTVVTDDGPCALVLFAADKGSYPAQAAS